MRNKIVTLALGIASLFLLLPQGAAADTFQFVDTTPAGPLFGGNITIEFTITAPSLPSSGHVTSITTSYSPIDGFAWNSAASGTCFGLSFPGDACTGIDQSAGLTQGANGFPAGSFLSPGTYISVFGGETLVITDLSTVPEPSSLLFLGFAIVSPLAAARLGKRARFLVS